MRTAARPAAWVIAPWVIAALASVLGGCPSSEHLLAVDLRTDYNPRAEFDRVLVVLDGERTVDVAVEGEADYVAGIRIAELFALPAGPHRLSVQLVEEDTLVAERPIVVELDADQVITALISRSCRDVDCPEACQGGVCVAEACTPETPDACPPMTECAEPTDCAGGSGCSEALCQSGTCLYREDATACEATEYCNPDSGCQPIDPIMPPACTTCVDPTFGDGGAVTLDFGGLPAPWTDSGTVQTDDGRIYVIARAGDMADGDYAVARLSADGQLDSTFGTGGVATFDVGADDRAHMLVETASGDVLVCGETDDQGVVARLDASGTLVSSFATGGVFLVDIAPNKDLVNGCAEMADGSILASGQAFFGPPNGADLQTVGLTAGGVLDASFAMGGSTAVHVGVGDEFGSGRRDATDRFVAYGSTYQGVGPSHDCLVLRYLADGTLDASFGTNGVVILDFGVETNRCTGLRPAPSGGLVGGGILELPGADDAALVYRLDESGAPVLGFGAGGVARIDLGCDSNSRTALELPDGRIAAVATGCPSGGAREGAVVFLDAAGALEDTLVVPGTDRADGLALDAQGRLLVYGSRTTGGDTAISVTRVLP